MKSGKTTASKMEREGPESKGIRESEDLPSGEGSDRSFACAFG